MKISVDRNVVELAPENQQETASLEVLWRVIVDCIKESKSLTPIGEYVPAKKNVARFVIEGVPGGKTQWSAQKAEEDCTYICNICNKYFNVKAGQDIPLCCGRPMDSMD